MHVDAREAQVEEVRVKEKLQVLEVCVCLKAHHKVLQRFFNKIVIRNNRHNNISLSIIAIIAISPIIAIKNTDHLTFK